jgi:hypothetical protein
MRALLQELPLAASFLLAVVAGRQQAVVCASASGISPALQGVVVVFYTVVVVSIVWGLTRVLRAASRERFARSYRLVELTRSGLAAAKGLCGRLKRSLHLTRSGRSGRPCLAERLKEPIAKLSWWQLALALIGINLLPNGFWVAIAILKQRRYNAWQAALVLSPASWLSYKAYFLGEPVVRLLGPLPHYLLKGLVVAALIMAAAVLADLALLVAHRSRRSITRYSFGLHRAA